MYIKPIGNASKIRSASYQHIKNMKDLSRYYYPNLEKDLFYVHVI